MRIALSIIFTAAVLFIGYSIFTEYSFYEKLAYSLVPPFICIPLIEWIYRVFND